MVFVSKCSSIFTWLLFLSFSKWWSEAQEKKRLVADTRDTKVKKKLKELKLHPGFPNPAVVQAYLQPSVDQSDSSFSWGRPQVDMIKEYPLRACVYRCVMVCVAACLWSFLNLSFTFCLSRFGWSSRRTEETLQPLIKQLNTQQVIDTQPVIPEQEFLYSLIARRYVESSTN